MLIKILDRFPGGRFLIFLIPLLSALLSGFVFTSTQTLFINSIIILTFSIAVMVVWRRNFLIFFEQQKHAGVMWLSLGTFSIVTTTAITVGYSLYIRIFSVPVNDTIVSILRSFYAFGFACLFLAPLSSDGEVPIKGWIALGLILAIAIAMALVGIAYL